MTYEQIELYYYLAQKKQFETIDINSRAVAAHLSAIMGGTR